jgi:hypothetical protein
MHIMQGDQIIEGKKSSFSNIIPFFIPLQRESSSPKIQEKNMGLI